MPLYLVSIKVAVKEIDPQNPYNMPIVWEKTGTFEKIDRDLIENANEQLRKLQEWLDGNLPAGANTPGTLIVMPGVGRGKKPEEKT